MNHLVAAQPERLPRDTVDRYQRPILTHPDRVDTGSDEGVSAGLSVVVHRPDQP